MSDYETILFEAKNGIGRLTLNRPDHMNGMTSTMLRETYEALSLAAQDSSLKVVVLTGAGTSFCPGADLNYYTDGSSEKSSETSEPEFFQVAVLLHEMPQVTIAAINGACAGAGLGWANACDIRLASSNAMFNTAFLAVGVAGDMGGPWMLPRLVGAAKARELCFLPDKFSAEEALRIGMVARVFPQETFRQDVDSIIARFEASAPLALRGLKQNFVAAESMGYAEFIAHETALHTELMATEDSTEAFKAFVEKRTPRYQGK
jgi:2-(1,2-epoxy-1,2-dihydrophenyl)acetyl-CoA isomerase